MTTRDYIRKHLRLRLDVPAADLVPKRLAEDCAKLDSNENPYDPLLDWDLLLKGLAANRYPDSAMAELRSRLANYLGCSSPQVIIGNGCDELIDLLIRVTMEPGQDTALTFPPSFIMYRIFAENHGTQLITFDRDENYAIPVQKAVESAPESVRLVFVASPNNPTGGLVSDEELDILLSRDWLVAVDETYCEFAGQSACQRLETADNLIVLRSFSKAWSLAGLRFGFGACHPDLAQAIWSVKAPYSVNLVAQQAAIQTLDRMDQWEEVFAYVRAERERIRGALDVVPALDVFPSEANFLFCHVLKGADELRRCLDHARVSVRWLSSPWCDCCLRVTVGRSQDNDAFLAAVEKWSTGIGG